MLIVWTNPEAQQFRDFVRPLLQNCGVKYKVVSGSAIPPDPKPDDLVLVMGTDRLKRIQALGYGHKGRAITSQRGLVLGTAQKRFMVTWDSVIIDFDWGRRPEIAWDIKLAARLLKTGSLTVDTGSYKPLGKGGLAARLTEIEKIAKKTGLKVAVELDLETLGTDYMATDGYIVAVSLCYQLNHGYVRHYANHGKSFDKEDMLAVKAICCSPHIKLYGANFKYDMLWLMQKWGLTDFSAFAMDTTLVGSLLDENRSNSLNLHAKIYSNIGGYDDGFNRKYDKSRMDLVPKDEIVQYAGGDTDAGLQVAHKQRKSLLKNKKLSRFYADLLRPASVAVAKMEHRGMVVDRGEYERLDEEVTLLMVESQARMIDLLPVYLKHRHKTDLRPSRPKIVSDFLFEKRALGIKPKMMTEKTKKPSTAAEHFEMFADHKEAGPFIDALLKYRHAEKTKSTYIDGFLKHLRSDGRFHPSYMLFRGLFHGDDSKSDDSGGRTGRTSCKEPAYQTIPKHTVWAKPLRRVYTVPEGYVILNVDFQQGELRITACIADEATMIQSYKDGIDLHLKTGAELNSIEFAEALAMKMSNDPEVIKMIKKIRQGGKAGNFGLIYTMGAEGFVDYARKSYGVTLTVSEAQAFKNAFFNLYPGLVDWHESTRKFAHKHQFIDSPMGRRRRVPLVNSFAQGIRAKQERQAINAGVQSTLTDMGLLAMAQLDKQYPDLWQFGFTHDAISFYVPEHEALAWAQRIKSVMENLPLAHFGWKPQLDFPVDVELGLMNLADVDELQV